MPGSPKPSVPSVPEYIYIFPLDASEELQKAKSFNREEEIHRNPLINPSTPTAIPVRIFTYDNKTKTYKMTFGDDDSTVFSSTHEYSLSVQTREKTSVTVLTLKPKKDSPKGK